MTNPARPQRASADTGSLCTGIHSCSDGGLRTENASRTSWRGRGRHWKSGIAASLDMDSTRRSSPTSTERHSLPIDEVIFFVGQTTLSRIDTGFIFGRYKPRFVQEPDGRLTLIRVPKAKNDAIGVVSELLIRLYAPALLRTAAANVQAGWNRVRTSGAKQQDGIEQTRLIGAFENALFGRALRAARESNHRMSILAANLSGDDRRVLHNFCRDNGVTFLEISPRISAGTFANAESGLIFGEYDRHWNAKANALIAQELLAEMRN